MLGMIRSFQYKDRKTMLLLYKSMVRLHLEYAVQAWCPNKISDFKLLEGVQQRFTKCILCFFNRRFIKINKTMYMIAESERHKEYS